MHHKEQNQPACSTTTTLPHTHTHHTHPFKAAPDSLPHSLRHPLEEWLASALSLLYACSAQPTRSRSPPPAPARLSSVKGEFERGREGERSENDPLPLRSLSLGGGVGRTNLLAADRSIDRFTWPLQLAVCSVSVSWESFSRSRGQHQSNSLSPSTHSPTQRCSKGCVKGPTFDPAISFARSARVLYEESKKRSKRRGGR